MNQFTPISDLEIILSRWRLLILIVLIGGLAGWLYSLGNPPIYEARSSMVFFLDEGQREKLPDTQFSLSFNNLNTILSPRAQGPILIQEFGKDCKDMTIYDLQIERRETNWDLVVRCPDAKAAADIANAWADNAFSVVSDAYGHSLKVESLATTIDFLKRCNYNSSLEVCSGITDTDIVKQKMQTLWDEVGVEKRASMGINPNLVFRIESYANIPIKPVAKTVKGFIVSGGVIGLLIGTLLIIFNHQIQVRKNK